MFYELVGKECKLILKSVMYYIFIISMILFYIVQMGELDVISKPMPGKNDYGTIISTDKNVIMETSVRRLYGEYIRNDYSAYPVLFYKSVKLSDEKQDKVKLAIEYFTGEPIASFEDENKDITMKKNITYEEFESRMNDVDKILGGGSYYKPSNLKKNAKVNMNYEQALESYNSLIKNDKITGAYARVYCDYMNVMLGIFPVFLIVSRCLQDKRSSVDQVIYTKRAGTASIILSRYISCVIMIMIPIIILSINPCIQSLYMAADNGISANAFIFLKYIGGLLLPTTLFVTAVGLLLTEVLDRPLAILIQGIFWFVNVFIAKKLTGYVSYNLMPRFNELGFYDIYESVYNELVINRCMYTIIAVILLIATIAVYNLKRKGRLSIHGKVYSDGQSKSEV